MPSQPLRCVFVTLSPLLSAIVADALSRRVDFQLLAQFDQGEGLAERLEALTPDLAVIGVNRADSEDLGTSLLARLPRAKILLLSTSADLACLYEMRPHRQVLTDFSPDTLLAAILGAGDVAGPGKI
jgi:DNA-binding NarL/FixJ family response regulator